MRTADICGDGRAVATGGPNLGVAGVALVERVIDLAPGNAAEVLLKSIAA